MLVMAGCTVLLRVNSERFVMRVFAKLQHIPMADIEQIVKMPNPCFALNFEVQMRCRIRKM